MSFAKHAPVMEREAIGALNPINKGIYVDATIGGGGYARGILGSANCTVVGFDRDPTAIERASSWSHAYGGRLKLVSLPFADLEAGLVQEDIAAIDGIVFDLGVSSMQLDEAARGFSFRLDGPLSMRMDDQQPNAADVVNKGEIGDLAAIFKIYGEEKFAKKVARAIVAERAKKSIETTAHLAEIVSSAVPTRPQDKIHPATRVFQALRIFVNDELGQLTRALVAAEKMLRPAGRLVVVTFHSLEDRIVKRFLADRSGKAGGASRHAPPSPTHSPTFRHLFTKAQLPSEEEIHENPRARSAKLRCGIRLDQTARLSTENFAPPVINLSKSLQHWSR